MIELTAPASLPLGLVPIENAGQQHICLLGVTLQCPVVYLTAQAHRALQISGARADLAHQQARQFLHHHRLPAQGELRVELAIPAFMGLGSQTMLGLSTARALSWLHRLPLEAAQAQAQALGIGRQHALELWGFDQGGLLLVDTQPQADKPLPPLVRRCEIVHPDERAWAFVFFLPRVPPGTAAALEQERMAALLHAALHLAPAAESPARQLQAALEQDNIRAFAQALMLIQQQTAAALARAGIPPHFTDEEQTLLNIMRDGGALAWGRSPGGLALYGLIEGAAPSRALRRHLRQHIGIYGGTVMAAITDNTGARHSIKR